MRRVENKLNKVICLMFALRYFDVFVFLECSEGGLQPFAPK